MIARATACALPPHYGLAPAAVRQNFWNVERVLLKYPIEQHGQFVRREQLLNHVRAYDRSPSVRTVDSHLARLRQKIEDAPAVIKFIG